MYTIRAAGLKGLGVFATTHIPRGTRILAEAPLVTVKGEREVYGAITRLPQHDIAFIRALSVNAGNNAMTILDRARAAWNLISTSTLPTPSIVRDYSALLSAFRNNNFDLGAGVQALFTEISRFNHSCVPSCQGNFNSALGKFTVHATRGIEAGEEMTVSYLGESGVALREERRGRLWRGFGFWCGCGICDEVSNDGGSEGRRTGMRDRLREFAIGSADSNGRGQVEVDVLGELIGLFESEGLGGRELGMM